MAYRIIFDSKFHKFRNVLGNKAKASKAKVPPSVLLIVKEWKMIAYKCYVFLKFNIVLCSYISFTSYHTIWKHCQWIDYYLWAVFWYFSPWLFVYILPNFFFNFASYVFFFIVFLNLSFLNTKRYLSSKFSISVKVWRFLSKAKSLQIWSRIC